MRRRLLQRGQNGLGNDSSEHMVDRQIAGRDAIDVSLKYAQIAEQLQSAIMSMGLRKS